MYAAESNGYTLTFEPIAVWRRNMVMRDHQTGSIWQHATGESLAGPMKGAQLAVLNGEQCIWADWLRRYPASQVPYDLDLWRGRVPLNKLHSLLEKVTQTGKLPSRTPGDLRLPQNKEVIGVVVTGESCAYPLDELRRLGEIRDSVGGANLHIMYDSTAQRVEVWRQDSQLGMQPHSFTRTWWNGWYEFHPGSRVYKSTP